MADMKFEILTENEFNGFAKSHPQGSFVQTSEFSKVRNANGFTTELIGVKKDGEIIAASVLANHKDRINRYDMLCGPLIDWNDINLVKFFTTSIRQHVSNFGGDLISITPNIIYNLRYANGELRENCFGSSYIRTLRKFGWYHQGFDIGYNGQPRWLFVKDMRCVEYEDVMSSYNSSTRRKIRKSLKIGLKVSGIHDDDIPQLHDILEKTAKEKHFDYKSLAYLEALKHYLKIDVRFMNVQYEGNILAVGVFIVSANELVYLFGGKNEDIDTKNAAHLLQDWAIRYCVENSIPRYNFYGIGGIFDGSDGVLEFKKGFGGYVEELLGEFVLPINKWKYLAWKLFKKLRN